MTESKQPHVLLITVDHWPATLFGVAGHPAIMTPTLDQLAHNGIRFTQFYSSCPVCIPARRSLMTGLYPRSHGDRVYSAHMTMPEVPTLAQCYRDAGYQAWAVGKLHVYPQRDRIGFDDVILTEEGRYEMGVVDDYQLWLGDQELTGMEFSHGMSNNEYWTRPWPLPETAHQTYWATEQMIRTIKRRDARRPQFLYLSYMYPHPPLVPPRDYWELYEDVDIPTPLASSWPEAETPLIADNRAKASQYADGDRRRALRAFYAQCTYIDHQLRRVIGTLREEGMLNDTIIAFTSDHGDMLFDHDLLAKRCFYQNACNIPLILSGRPLAVRAGEVSAHLGSLEDLMPTLLELSGIPVPDTVEGRSILDEGREGLFGEISDGRYATRMYTDGRHKLIYYRSAISFSSSTS